MMRKQEEAKHLHDLLASWIFRFELKNSNNGLIIFNFRYMELQEAKNVVATHAEIMLYE